MFLWINIKIPCWIQPCVLRNKKIKSAFSRSVPVSTDSSAPVKSAAYTNLYPLSYLSHQLTLKLSQNSQIRLESDFDSKLGSSLGPCYNIVAQNPKQILPHRVLPGDFDQTLEICSFWRIAKFQIRRLNWWKKQICLQRSLAWRYTLQPVVPHILPYLPLLRN